MAQTSKLPVFLASCQDLMRTLDMLRKSESLSPQIAAEIWDTYIRKRKMFQDDGDMVKSLIIWGFPKGTASGSALNTHGS